MRAATDKSLRLIEGQSDNHETSLRRERLITLHRASSDFKSANLNIAAINSLVARTLNDNLSKNQTD